MLTEIRISLGELLFTVKISALHDGDRQDLSYEENQISQKISALDCIIKELWNAKTETVKYPSLFPTVNLRSKLSHKIDGIAYGSAKAQA